MPANRQKPLPAWRPRSPRSKSGNRTAQARQVRQGTAPVAAGRTIQLVLKPKDSAIDVKQRDGKGKAEPTGAGLTSGRSRSHCRLLNRKYPDRGLQKKDGKDKPESAGANAGAIAIGHQKSLLAPTKFSEIEVRKQDGKGKQNSATASRS